MKLQSRKIAILCCSLVLICAITFSARFIHYIPIPVFRLFYQVILFLLNGLIAWIAMKATGMNVGIDFKNRHSYWIGAMIALMLSIVIAMVPALLGFSLIGNHTDFSWFVLIYDFIFYLFIIGPAEEFVFRVYVQDTLVSVFPKHQWIGVVIASFLFGLWHIINGSVLQVLFTFGIGLVFGFAKYKIKDCGYVGVAFGHGLYDFLNTLVRIFIV